MAQRFQRVPVRACYQGRGWSGSLILDRFGLIFFEVRICNPPKSRLTGRPALGIRSWKPVSLSDYWFDGGRYPVKEQERTYRKIHEREPSSDYWYGRYTGEVRSILVSWKEQSNCHGFKPWQFRSTSDSISSEITLQISPLPFLQAISP